MNQKEARNIIEILKVNKKLEEVNDDKYSVGVNKLADLLGYDTKSEREYFAEVMEIAGYYELVEREYKGKKFKAIKGYKLATAKPKKTYYRR